MNILNLEELHLSGVYAIVNTHTGYKYIGSTTMTFLKRFQHHYSSLKADKHKNDYLQNSWNKHGESAFEFRVLEICDKSQCLSVEQEYINNGGDLFNINPLASGTPNMSKETIEKRRQTMLKKYSTGELKSTFIGRIPWNKGLKLKDTRHLKVSKTITEKVINSRAVRKIKVRSNLPKIVVKNLEGDILGEWRSAIDLQEESLKNDFILIPYVKSRFKRGRFGFPPYYLESKYINMCANNKLHSYKMLKFEFITAPS